MGGSGVIVICYYLYAHSSCFSHFLVVHQHIGDALLPTCTCIEMIESFLRFQILIVPYVTIVIISFEH